MNTYISNSESRLYMRSIKAFSNIKWNNNRFNAYTHVYVFTSSIDAGSLRIQSGMVESKAASMWTNSMLSGILIFRGIVGIPPWPPSNWDSLCGASLPRSWSVWSSPGSLLAKLVTGVCRPPCPLTPATKQNVRVAAVHERCQCVRKLQYNTKFPLFKGFRKRLRYDSISRVIRHLPSKKLLTVLKMAISRALHRWFLLTKQKKLLLTMYAIITFLVEKYNASFNRPTGNMFSLYSL